MNLAIVLVHNKGDQENFNQIEAVKPLVTLITDHNTSVDAHGVSFSYDTYHYELKGLTIPHILRLYQILPFGIKEPSNFNAIDSHNVLYRKGDEDKIGDHPRFFNWGLKRATDYGADIVIHLDDYTKFDIAQIQNKIAALVDPNNKTEFAEHASGKLSTLKLLKEVGQLDETKPKLQAILNLKERVSQKGLQNG